jgi:hypothetical protein
VTRPFDRLNVDTQGFDISDYNRLADSVQRQTSSQGAGLPMIDTSAGTGSYMRGDVSRMFMIQVSGVVTTVAAGIPVVPAYDWTEVVRVNGAYAVPGDARTGTVTTFPAFDTQMSPNVTLNIGSTTSAYLANLSWDETSLEFVGKDAATGGSGGGGVIQTFAGCRQFSKFESVLFPIGGDRDWAINFKESTGQEFDTGGFHETVLHPERFTAPMTGYYHVGGTLVIDNTLHGGLITRIKKNGVQDLATGLGVTGEILAVQDSPGFFIASASSMLSAIVFLNSGQWVVMTATVSAGGTLTQLPSQFWMYRIGI